jgi:hypothetical protein
MFESAAGNEGSVRRAPWRPGAVIALLTACLASWVSPATAQTCTSSYEYSGAIRSEDGNVWFDHTDGALPALAGKLQFRRHYNSRFAFAGVGGVLGRGWSHSYEDPAPGAVGMASRAPRRRQRHGLSRPGQ